jgi:SSS family solute:Na+ symporter
MLSKLMVQILLLLAYAAAQIALGLYAARRVRGAGDFFVAGRRLGPGLLFATLLAANIGAGSTVGAAGLGYRAGLSAWWWVGSAAIGSLLLAWSVGPRIWQVAAAHDLHTVGDYLEWRYDRRVRAAITILLWFGTLAILAGQFIALAWLLDVVLGIPKVAGCSIGGIVVTTYFTAGGLRSSAAVNVVQLTVKLIGFALAFPLALAGVGGLSGMKAVLPSGAYWSPWQNGSSGWMLLAMLAPAFIVSPGLLQKIYGARDERSVRLGVTVNALGLFLFAAVPPLLGMAARVHHPALENPELALPELLMSDLPAVVGGLSLAALFSAEMSAADAILFMLATSLSQDLYHRFIDPAASDRNVLSVARGAAVAGGALATALAIAAPTILGALSVFYTLLGVSLFVPLVAGLYVRRTGAVEALAAIAAGVSLVIAARIGAGGATIQGLTPAMIGLAGACVAWALARLGKHERSEVANST